MYCLKIIYSQYRFVKIFVICSILAQLSSPADSALSQKFASFEVRCSQISLLGAPVLARLSGGF